MAKIKISDAEMELLQLLWAASPLTAAELAETAPRERGWHLAKVKTLLSRLVTKGAVRAEADGRRFLHHPMIARDALAVEQAGRLVDRMFWAAEMLGATSVLIALVLRGAVARHFGTRAAYALWLAPLLRFVVPSMTPPMVAPQIWIDTSSAAASTLAPVSAAFPLETVLVGVWLGGALLFLVGHLIAYRRFVAGALHEATAVTEAGIDDAAILASAAVTGPAATGLFVRRIFVPHDFAAVFEPEERRLALRHEVLHHRRGDLWASATALT